MQISTMFFFFFLNFEFAIEKMTKKCLKCVDNQQGRTLYSKKSNINVRRVGIPALFIVMYVSFN